MLTKNIINDRNSVELVEQPEELKEQVFTKDQIRQLRRASKALPKWGMSAGSPSFTSHYVR